MFAHETVVAGAVPAPKKLSNVLIHFRKRKNDGTICTREGATILIRQSLEHAGFYQFAIARCGKKDVFSRKIGRAIVEGRMRKDHTFIAEPSEAAAWLYAINAKYRERYNPEFFQRLLDRLA